MSNQNLVLDHPGKRIINFAVALDQLTVESQLTMTGGESKQDEQQIGLED